ncbi:DNA glycosylase [Artomyces pyxidatus]|uniref:DNA glycosylase n=1 Tax=Artomyces pyxidatus TaxID=48021 RepID=A0ACB8T1F6_9AGAM|nr:DNA glycosylase [Artomyces pyxidatus]
MKRSMSSKAIRLTSHPSSLDSSVQLFKLEDVDPGEADPSRTLRRSKRVKLDKDGDGALIQDLEDTVPPTASRKPKAAPTSPKKQKAIPQALDKPHPPPSNWKEVYDAIAEMRSRVTAPVDTMGCDMAQRNETDPKNKRFTTLVSLMLSSQTKDEVTDAAVNKLREAIGGTLSINALIAANDSVISEAINKVGFWRRKSQYIKQAAQRLRDNFDSDVPKTVDELCSLPGVGPKMAFLTLQSAWKINVGIGVDVHVHRITNLLKWHKPPTKTPEETRLNLQSWLPKELHPEINHLLVGFGQTICVPVRPRCDQCTLSSNSLCPSAQKVVTSKSRKSLVMASSSGPKLEISVEETSLLTISKYDPQSPSDPPAKPA